MTKESKTYGFTQIEEWLPDMKKYTCSFADCDNQTSLHFSECIDHRPGGVRYVNRKELSDEVGKFVAGKDPLHEAVERLADAFLVSILQSGRTRYLDDPLQALKQARWFLDNTISHLEKNVKMHGRVTPFCDICQTQHKGACRL